MIIRLGKHRGQSTLLECGECDVGPLGASHERLWIIRRFWDADLYAAEYGDAKGPPNKVNQQATAAFSAEDA